MGQTLGLSADAAQKRVSRALEKCRGILAQRGVKVPGAVLGSAIAANAVQAAPAGLVSVITSAALAKTGASAGLGFLLHKATRLTTAQTAALTALVGIVPILFEGRRLTALHAEQAQLSGRLAQAQRTLAGLQDQDANLRQRLVRNDNAIRQLQTRATTPAAPAPGEMPAYVRVPKDLLG